MRHQQAAKIGPPAHQNKRQTSIKPTSTTLRSLPPLLKLQQTIGNQAVQRMLYSGAIQAKLRIGRPGDVYEQEADRVAEQVMRMPDPQTREAVPVSGRAHTPQLQRECAECQEKEEEKEGLQLKPLADSIIPLVQRQTEEEEEEEVLQAKPLAGQITPLVQRQVEPEEETLYAKEVPGQTSRATPAVEAHLNSIRGGGRPLSGSERTFFEPRFGHDFGHVRVHSDARAAETAKSINARAFTRGSDIVFGSGQYAPGTIEGRQLLSHELIHILQQQHTALGLIQRQERGSVHNNNEEEAHRTPITRLDFSLSWDELSDLFGILQPTLPTLGAVALRHPMLRMRRTAPPTLGIPTLRHPVLPPLAVPPTLGQLRPTQRTLPLTTPQSQTSQTPPTPEMPSRLSILSSGHFSLGVRFSFPELEALKLKEGVGREINMEEVNATLNNEEVPTGLEAIDNEEWVKIILAAALTYVGPKVTSSLRSAVSAPTGPGGTSYELDAVILGDFEGAGLSITIQY